MANITLVGLHHVKYVLNSAVMWQIGGRESLNAPVELLKWPHIPYYSRIRSEL